MKTALAILFFTFTSPAFAGTNTYCGVMTQSDGSTFLANAQGREILELAEQGGSQSLLTQANKLMSGGLKSGQAYCLNVMVNANGSPIRVLKAKPDLLAAKKKSVLTVTSDPKKTLPNADAKKPETLKEAPTTPQ
jgi:hypothetical protein